MDEQAWAAVVGASIQGGAFFLVAWLVRRVFQHTIPRLSEDFKESLSTVTKTFKEELREQRNDFKEELRESRKDFHAALQAEREYLGKRIDRLSDGIENLVKEMRERP